MKTSQCQIQLSRMTLNLEKQSSVLSCIHSESRLQLEAGDARIQSHRHETIMGEITDRKWAQDKLSSNSRQAI